MGDKLETIHTAAVRFANGNIYSNETHAQASDDAYESGEDMQQDRDDGYVTSYGRFISRNEAYKLAMRAGQLDKKAYKQKLRQVAGNDADPNTYGLEAQAFEYARESIARQIIDRLVPWVCENEPEIPQSRTDAGTPEEEVYPVEPCENNDGPANSWTVRWSDEAYACYIPQRQRLVLYILVADQNIRGRQMLRWLTDHYGLPIDVIEVEPRTEGYWDKMEYGGLVRSWTPMDWQGGKQHRLLRQ